MTKDMTLWEAYRLANRRRAAVSVSLVDGGLGNGRTERSLRVMPHRQGGTIAVEQGTTSDLYFVPDDDARGILVTRDWE